MQFIIQFKAFVIVALVGCALASPIPETRREFEARDPSPQRFRPNPFRPPPPPFRRPTPFRPPSPPFRRPNQYRPPPPPFRRPNQYRPPPPPFRRPTPFRPPPPPFRGSRPRPPPPTTPSTTPPTTNPVTTRGINNVDDIDGDVKADLGLDVDLSGLNEEGIEDEGEELEARYHYIRDVVANSDSVDVTAHEFGSSSDDMYVVEDGEDEDSIFNGDSKVGIDL